MNASQNAAPDPFEGMTDPAVLMIAAGYLQAGETAKFRAAMAELDRRRLAEGLERAEELRSMAPVPPN